MVDSVDIRSLPGAGVYQLFLPEQVATTLHLTEADGNALFIIHENKMQLEWLSQRIWQQYHSLKNAFTVSKVRLKRKKRLAVIILVFAGLITLFSSGIARQTHVNILYINTFVITVGVFCCLQLLKYFAKGVSFSDSDFVSELQISELKESILKDFSPED